MADTPAERQRRRRAHAAGDHRLCLPARCSLAGAGRPEPTQPASSPPSPAAAANPAESDLQSVAAAIAADIEALGDLVGIEGSLAAIALKLGRAIDVADDPKLLAALSREARSTLTDLTMSLQPGRRPGGGTDPQAGTGGEVTDDNDGWSGMDTPV